MIEYDNLSLEELLRHTHAREAWYWLGMAYFKRNDFGNAVMWLEKTMNDPGNEWAGKAAHYIGELHVAKVPPNSSRDKALRLLLSNLNEGFKSYFAEPYKCYYKK